MSERKKWLDRASYWSAMIATAAGIVAAVIMFATQKFAKFEITGARIDLSTREISITKRIETIGDEITVMKSQITQLTKIPETVRVATKLKELDAKVVALQSNLDALNKAIMSSPEKALEVPMLKRDISALQAQHENATKSLEREITRAYDTIKWVIGTIALGILGLAASVFLKGKQ